MIANLDPTGRRLILRFAYRPRLVEWVKTLPDRRYDPVFKTWSVPLHPSVVQQLAEKGFQGLEAAQAALAPTVGEETLATQEFEAEKPVISQIADLIINAYQKGAITQQQQSDMLDLINHISLKDFINHH